MSYVCALTGEIITNPDRVIKIGNEYFDIEELYIYTEKHGYINPFTGKPLPRTIAQKIDSYVGK